MTYFGGSKSSLLSCLTVQYITITTGFDNSSSAGKDSVKVLDYFTRNIAPCPPDANPAEHIVDIVQGNTEAKIDWVEVWNRSEERKRAIAEFEALNAACQANQNHVEDTADFATSYWFQFKTVLHRLMHQLWRAPVSI